MCKCERSYFGLRGNHWEVMESFCENAGRMVNKQRLDGCRGGRGASGLLGGKSARRFLWDIRMLMLFLYKERKGDKCLIEDLWMVWSGGGVGGGIYMVLVVKGSG